MASSSSHGSSSSEFQRETSVASKKMYDAFINHRGPDDKDTLAFALYDSLEEKGFWTFLDDMELELGGSIESAIQNAIYSSKVQITIFSPQYAESSWCLNELLLMLETEVRFIPIFCGVKPMDVRYPDKGVYAAAFAKHQQKGRFSKEKIDQWKAALHSSSHISGYEITTSHDNVEIQQDVGEMRYSQQLHLSSCVCEILKHLIKSITHRSDLHADAAASTQLEKSGYVLNKSDVNVERLCREIALAVQQEVEETFKGVGKHQKGLHADEAASTSTPAIVKKSSLLPRDSHPVGIDSKVDDMVGLLKDSKDQVIAVVGMGGLGKTFLLQNVYKAVKSNFDHSIWLSISKSYSVEKLQRDIASKIGLNSEIVNAKVTEERAAELIHNHLQGKRFLFVLDDLWTLSTENSLLDKLCLPNDKDCKVVVTTRNRQVALNSGAQIYDMKKLSDEESWRLFCIYAFPRSIENRAPLHLEEEARKIVK